METRAAMAQLAPLVAEAKGLEGIDDGDYVAVIRALKKDTIPNDQLEARYRKVIDAIDPIIRKQGIVDVPKRPMVMRLGSTAESAAQPAPHFLPAPLVGNTGQQGQFVLPVSVPNPDGSSLEYDDFNFESAAWTLSAHEGRPGHELQFTAMVERGISLARTLFAFNSVNVEGWALYAEAEMLPYEPLDGQMIALQLRLLRGARAVLDPMLNLGLIDRESARRVLEEEVGVSPAMAKQELDRYMFNAPGQAGSYFYGYSRILQLRMDTELALGDRFSRLGFNNFLLDQGLLPPDLLAKAVEEEFIPAHRERGTNLGRGRSRSQGVRTAAAAPGPAPAAARGTPAGCAPGLPRSRRRSAAPAPGWCSTRAPSPSHRASPRAGRRWSTGARRRSATGRRSARRTHAGRHWARRP